MSKKNYTRKDFLGKITAATLSSVGAGILLPSMAEAESDKASVPPAEISKEATILFQGDSITDAGRNRKDITANSQGGLGVGYAFLAASHLRHRMATHNLRCYNRGVSGDKVFQLADRWEKDCLKLKPDVLSILVGVNDFWHTLDHSYDGTAETYENDYRILLNRTQKALPDVKLIIGEPFVIAEGSAIVEEEWFPEFTKYQAAAKQMAKDTGAAFIPYQSIFNEAGGDVPPSYWAADGVHPTTAGCHLMAQAWLETVKRL